MLVSIEKKHYNKSSVATKSMDRYLAVEQKREFPMRTLFL